MIILFAILAFTCLADALPGIPPRFRTVEKPGIPPIFHTLEKPGIQPQFRIVEKPGIPPILQTLEKPGLPPQFHTLEKPGLPPRFFTVENPGLPPNSTAARMLSTERDADGMVIVGDMKMSEAQILQYFGTLDDRTLGESRTILRWPNGVVSYKIDPSLGNQKHTDMIRKAMAFWEAETCIKFEEIKDPATPHIYLTNGKGCNSYVGFIVNKNNCCIGKQTVNLQMPDCERISTICHELGHAIGLQHEMSRPDRDNYLNVFTNNTDPENLNNFERLTTNIIHDVVPYDFTSAMHYWIEGGNNKYNHLVVTPKDPSDSALIRRSMRPSFYDYKLVNHMYGCNSGCNIDCLNGGYATKSTAKGCHCLCPYDTAGTKCETKVTVDECRKIFVGEGMLKPPNRNDPYDESPKCSIIMKAPAGKKVSVEFRSMNLDCTKNQKVIIRNSNLSGDKIYSSYCQVFSNIRTQPILSEGNEMQIILFNKVTSDAFEAEIKYV